MKRIFFGGSVGIPAAAILATTAFQAIAADAVFFVAPTGNDAAPGTREKPFATITRARDATRTIPAGTAKRIVVGGGQFFNVDLTLTPEDSGLTIEAAPDERPALIGGVRITGWRKNDDGTVSAVLPEYPGGPTGPNDLGRWEVRWLLVNGKRRPRARFPAEGTLPHESRFDVSWMSTTGGGWKRKPTHEELTTLRYRPGDLPHNLEIANTEVTVFHMWDESCVGVASNRVEENTLILAPETGHPPGAFGVRKFVVWNTREGLLKPGQWYHDRVRQRLVYWPLPGEDLNNAEVVAPTRTTILRVQGTRDRPVKDVTIRGLTFTCTTVPLKAGGFAAAAFDGAISLQNTEDCTLTGLTISGVAGHAINTARSADKELRIEKSEVAFCGAGGIYAGGSGTVISNNHVHAVGLSFPSAIGIYRGGRSNLVSHNEIHDCPYSGINYGGDGNVIADNLIYDCMKVLHDGGAIYVFAGRGCVLRGNLARDIVDTGGYGASAYYLDERSRGCVVEENLSLRVNWPSHNHMATNNVIRNNVFVVEGDARITFPRSSDYSVHRNVIAARGKIRFENPAGATNWIGNLLFSEAGRIEWVGLRQYSAEGTNAAPAAGWIQADPKFADRAAGDFRFASDSPAHDLGIRAVDVSRAGRVK